MNVGSSLLMTLFCCHLAVVSSLAIILAVRINKSLLRQFARQGEWRGGDPVFCFDNSLCLSLSLQAGQPRGKQYFINVQRCSQKNK